MHLQVPLCKTYQPFPLSQVLIVPKPLLPIEVQQPIDREEPAGKHKREHRGGVPLEIPQDQ